MAAVDPTEEPEADEEGNVPAVPRSTLRLVKQRFGGDLEDEEDDFDEEQLRALMAGSADDEEDSDDDDEANGGPSDPSKKKGTAQLLEALKNAQDEDISDDDMDGAKPNGKSKKGKERASDDDDEDEEDDSEDDEDDEDLEQFVICTLDTERVRPQILSWSLAPSELFLEHDTANAPLELPAAHRHPCQRG